MLLGCVGGWPGLPRRLACLVGAQCRPGLGWPPIRDGTRSSEAPGPPTRPPAPPRPTSPAPAQINLLSCKFMSADGFGRTSDAVQCLDWCLGRGARIISASWTSGQLDNPPLEEAVARTEAAGALLVVSAGNQGADMRRHKFYPQVRPAAGGTAPTHPSAGLLAGQPLLRVGAAVSGAAAGQTTQSASTHQFDPTRCDPQHSTDPMWPPPPTPPRCGTAGLRQDLQEHAGGGRHRRVRRPRALLQL